MSAIPYFALTRKMNNKILVMSNKSCSKKTFHKNIDKKIQNG